MTMKKKCEHFDTITEKIHPTTEGCKECEMQGTNWIALRMCLTCGHVGCCDSSGGKHATSHFKKTGHPVMTALPNNAWSWCYVHKEYS
jgi:uncharacterized UBP type Zn finger protein